VRCGGVAIKVAFRSAKVAQKKPQRKRFIFRPNGPTSYQPGAAAPFHTMKQSVTLGKCEKNKSVSGTAIERNVRIQLLLI
jgi:hypothetical protein